MWKCSKNDFLSQVAAAFHPEGSTKVRWVKNACAGTSVTPANLQTHFCSSSDSLTRISKSLRALTSTVAFVSSCINPILYTFAGKSFIRREGLAFMARLFEATALYSTKIRQSNQNSREKETDEGGSLKDKDSDSITTPHTSCIIKVAPQKKGKWANGCEIQFWELRFPVLHGGLIKTACVFVTDEIESKLIL